MVAFLQETLEDDVQVKAAQGRDERYKNGEVLSYKIKNSLHNLSMSPNLWYDSKRPLLK